MSNEDTPTLDHVADLRTQRAALDAQITDLTPTAIQEGYDVGMRPETIADRLGLSVSRLHQIRRATNEGDPQ